MRWKSYGVSILAMSVTAVTACAADHTKDLLADVIKAVEDDKAVIIDVRELSEWNDGHLKNAKHLSLTELKVGMAADKLKKLLPEGKVVYLHCASGMRCLKAADLLKAAGYETRPLKDGYEDLQKAGFPKAN